MHVRGRNRWGAVAAALLAGSALAAGVPTGEAAAQGSPPILTVLTRPDLGCAILHRDDRTLAFWGVTFPGQGEPPDLSKTACGTFVAISTGQFAMAVFGPASLPEHFAGTGERLKALTPVSQTAIAGAGTTIDPFTVVTVVKAGDTGITVTQTDSWTTTSETVTSKIDVADTTGNDRLVTVSRVGECQEGGYLAFGVVKPGRAACIPAAYDGANRDIVRFVPGDAIIEMAGAGASGMVDVHSESEISNLLGHALSIGGAFMGRCVQCATGAAANLDLGIGWAIKVPGNSSTSVRATTTVSTGAARATSRLVTMTDHANPGVVTAVLATSARGAHVDGQRIRMLRDGVEVCSVRTDRRGRAKCGGGTALGTGDPAASRLAESSTVEVIFDGDLQLRPATKIVRLSKEPADPGTLPKPTECLPPVGDRDAAAEVGWSLVVIDSKGQWMFVGAGSPPGVFHMGVPVKTATCPTVKYSIVHEDGKLVAYLPGDGSQALDFNLLATSGSRLVTTRFRQPDVILSENPVAWVAPQSGRG